MARLVFWDAMVLNYDIIVMTKWYLPLSQPMMVSILMHKQITQPQWVNIIESILSVKYCHHYVGAGVLQIALLNVYITLPLMRVQLHNSWVWTYVDHCLQSAVCMPKLNSHDFCLVGWWSLDAVIQNICRTSVWLTHLPLENLGGGGNCRWCFQMHFLQWKCLNIN